ncbi:MAG: hypothetical protein K6T68_08470 [Alicyclobacillus shizuokensis]|nr:hypothetical protein [Alicyclobacillus shizuokensis]
MPDFCPPLRCPACHAILAYPAEPLRCAHCAADYPVRDGIPLLFCGEPDEHTNALYDDIAHLYDELHPAVLRLVQMTCDAARKAGIPVGMCGELAGDVHATECLVGLGLTELSMSAGSIPAVKLRLSEVDSSTARIHASEMLEK